MSINAGLMSSATPEWATPRALFDDLNREFGPLEMDVCATPDNAKLPRFITEAQNGLKTDWAETCWMNPPYGRTIGQWVERACTHHGRVVCLLPARTDTAWWHDMVKPYARVIRFLRGRVRFNDAGPAPFPSAVVVFDNRPGWEAIVKRDDKLAPITLDSFGYEGGAL